MKRRTRTSLLIALEPGQSRHWPALYLSSQPTVPWSDSIPRADPAPLAKPLAATYAAPPFAHLAAALASAVGSASQSAPSGSQLHQTGKRWAHLALSPRAHKKEKARPQKWS